MTMGRRASGGELLGSDDQVTITGDCGKNCATVKPVNTRRRRIVRIDPSGFSPYPRMTIAGFLKSFVAAAGWACATGADTSPITAAAASATAPKAAFHPFRTPTSPTRRPDDLDSY